MKKTVKFIVDEVDEGQRLDKFLSSKLSDYSRNVVQKFIKESFVFDAKNQPVINQKLIVNIGDEFFVNIPDINKNDSVMEAENIPLDILYEDEYLLVVNKPAGMVVHKGAGVSKGTLVNALLYHTNNKLSSIGENVGRQGIVHRLDKETSGLMIVCKNDKAHLILANDFANHNVKRSYYTIVAGILNPLSGVIDKNISRNPYLRQEMKIAKDGGKVAITNYETIKVFTGAKYKPISLVKCVLETGRTHQIRVHLSSQGNFVLGDKVYGNMQKFLTKIENQEVKNFLKNINRQLLHSKTLSFTHPVTKEIMKFETKLPKDMQEVVDFFENQI